MSDLAPPTGSPGASSVTTDMDQLRALAGPLFDAFAASGVAMMVTDPRQADEPIVYVNAAFEALTGYRDYQLVGRNCRILQADSVDRDAIAALSRDLNATGSGTADLLNRREDGSTFWNRVTVTTLKDAAGHPLYRFATQTDVSSEYVDHALGFELQANRRRLAEARERVRVAQAVAGAAGAWEWDIRRDRLITDARFASLYGLDPVRAGEGLPTSTFFEGVHDADKMRLRIAVAGVLHGAEVFARDYRLVVDGEERWVSARGRTYFDESEDPVRFAGVLADITDQKRIEERLRIAQNAGGVGTFEYVGGFGTAEVSEQFCRLLGLLPAASLPVRTINALVHPDDPLIVQGRDGAHELGPAFQEFRIRRADTGEVRWLASRGEYRAGVAGGVSYIGALYDITAAKESEARLRDLSEALAERVKTRTQERDRIWNFSQDLLFVANGDGRYLSVNPAWQQLLGFNEADLVGAPTYALIHQDDLALMRERLVGSSHETRAEEFDCRVRRRDGEFRWISWTLIRAGDLLYGTGRDITQRRMLEDQLRQSQKMEAVGQLTGGLAHDFNNMLTGVLGGLDMVRRRLAEGRSKDVDRYLDTAVQSAQRAAALTHRLLAFSRRQTLDSRPIDVKALATSMDDLLRRTLGEQVLLEIVMPDDLPRAVADANQLESAILNLAINARDAMPGGGNLTITAKAVELSAAEVAESDHAEPGPYVEICVADTGSGMSREVLKKVFDPFFTTKPIGQGTGLGLSMIYGFVQQSNGHIRIESREGEGAIIRLYLPSQSAEPPLDDTGKTDDPPAPTGSGETILVIEDDPAVRLLVMQVLRELGYNAIETADGASARPILHSDRHLDLLITDVGLPGLNGRQLAEVAREGRPDLPVLFMTGYAEQAADQARFLEPGMEILTKPFDIFQLGERIRRILASRS
jgi:PAS domain S-box-containing protein